MRQCCPKLDTVAILYSQMSGGPRRKESGGRGHRLVTYERYEASSKGIIFVTQVGRY